MTPEALRIAFPLVARRYVPLLASAATAAAFAWWHPVGVWIGAYRDAIQHRVFYSDRSEK